MSSTILDEDFDSPLVEEDCLDYEEADDAIKEEEEAEETTQEEEEVKDEEKEKKAEEVEVKEEIPYDPEKACLPFDFFLGMKSQPDSVAAVYREELRRRYVASEARSKGIEGRLILIHPEPRTTEEDRQEILGELLDKVDKAFDIIDEHEDRNIPMGHRIHLEGKLLGLINKRMDMIDEIMDKFDEMGSDKSAEMCEREMLRYEIRFLDIYYTEIHECFLKSYLEMEW